MTNNSNNWDDLFFWLAVTSEPDPRKRRLAIAIRVGVPLCALLVVLWLFLPHKTHASAKSETYAITGTEHTLMWELKDEEFLALFNERIKDDYPELTYLRAPDSRAKSRMLTDNGETWIILLSVFSQEDAEASWFKKEDGSAEWPGNIEKVKLHLDTRSPEEINKNECYSRCLIGIFTPGSEDRVVNYLRLSTALSDSETRSIKVGNVTYTCKCGSTRELIIEPG